MSARLRKRTTRRFIAAASVAALALTGASLSLAATAQAGTVTPVLECVLPAGQGTFSGPQSITVTLTPANPAPGSKVHAEVTLGRSTILSTQQLDATVLTPSLNLAMSGGATGIVTVPGAPQTQDIKKGEPVPIDPYSGDFFIPKEAKGKVDFTPIGTLTDTFAYGNHFPTTCKVTSGGGVVDSVTAEGEPVEVATLTGPTEPVLTGAAVSLTGTRWTPGATPKPALCDAAGCNERNIRANTLVIDGAGNLSGTATLTPDVPAGTYTVQVADGSRTASAAVTTKDYVVTGPPEATISANKGPLDSVIQVSVKNFRPNKFFNIVGFDGEYETDDVFILQPMAGPDGTLTVDFPVNTDRIKAIRVHEADWSSPFFEFPWTFGPADPTQKATGEVIAGKLSMTQAGTAVDFGSVQIDGTEQKMNGKLNQVTVGDYRSGKLGWTLTATATDLTSGNSVIPVGNLSWTPKCVAAPGSPGTAMAGSPGKLSTTASALCIGAPAATLSGGTFQADADMVLTTPKFPTPGVYTGTITLSLS